MLRVQVDGQRRDIGLGSDADLTLAEAREKAAHLRKIARQGKDPVAERDRHKQLVPTFAQAVDLAHAELAKGWEEKTGDAFRASLLSHRGAGDRAAKVERDRRGRSARGFLSPFKALF